MSIDVSQYMDDSELSAEELATWLPKLEATLTPEFTALLNALQASGVYPKTPEGLQHLRERAWDEAMDMNEVCRTMSAISAKRRIERALAEGSVAQLALPKMFTVKDIEQLLRAAQPDGELRHADGTEVFEGNLEHLADAMNDPEKRAEMMSHYEGTYEKNEEMAEMVYRMRLNRKPMFEESSAPVERSPQFAPQLGGFQSWPA
jgi:hypothetical protein